MTETPEPMDEGVDACPTCDGRGKVVYRAFGRVGPRPGGFSKHYSKDVSENCPKCKGSGRSVDALDAEKGEG